MPTALAKQLEREGGELDHLASLNRKLFFQRAKRRDVIFATK